MTLATPELLAQLERLLRDHPGGLREQALIHALRRAGSPTLPELERRDLFGLFRTHFRLFHALYRLRDELRADRAGELVPDPLCVRIERWRPGNPALAAPDPLAEWYRDASRLEAVGPEDVAAMLAEMSRRRRRPATRGRALAVLELEDPVDDGQIRRRYRELAMRHHPDRGGDAATFVAIQAAVRDLL